MRRRFIMGQGESIFPMKIDLARYATYYLRTPNGTTKVLCKYIKDNAIIDGGWWEVRFNPGQLTINGVEVETIYGEISGGEFLTLVDWDPSYKYYSMYSKYIILDENSADFGTIRVESEM